MNGVHCECVLTLAVDIVTFPLSVVVSGTSAVVVYTLLLVDKDEKVVSCVVVEGDCVCGRVGLEVVACTGVVGERVGNLPFEQIALSLTGLSLHSSTKTGFTSGQRVHSSHVRLSVLK